MYEVDVDVTREREGREEGSSTSKARYGVCISVRIIVAEWSRSGVSGASMRRPVSCVLHFKSGDHDGVQYSLAVETEIEIDTRKRLYSKIKLSYAVCSGVHPLYTARFFTTDKAACGSYFDTDILDRYV